MGLVNADIWIHTVFEAYSMSGNNETAENRTGSQLRRQMYWAPAVFYTRAPVTLADRQRSTVSRKINWKTNKNPFTRLFEYSNWKSTCVVDKILWMRWLVLDKWKGILNDFLNATMHKKWQIEWSFQLKLILIIKTVKYWKNW